MKKVLIGKKTETFIICIVLALGAIFMIRVVIFLFQPISKGGYYFIVEEDSTYEILNTDKAKYILPKTKEKLIKYMKKNNLKIKKGKYVILEYATFSQIIDDLDFVDTQ